MPAFANQQTYDLFAPKALVNSYPLYKWICVQKTPFTIASLEEIAAGSVIALGLGVANHDPEKFEEPEVFDITRTPN